MDLANPRTTNKYDIILFIWKTHCLKIFVLFIILMAKISDSTCVMIDCKGSACLMALVFQTPDKPIFSNVSLS